MERRREEQGRKVQLTAGARLCWLAAALAAWSLFTMTGLAQTSAERIRTEIDNSVRTTLRGTHPPQASAANDIGQVPIGMRLHGMNMFFSRTAAQEAALKALIAAQQNPSSRLYHRWLTPDEFAERFGIANSDLSKVRAWLEQQGFSVDSVSRRKNRITFSGTAGQVQTAFGTELHYYGIHGKRYYAPARDIGVPGALSSVVVAVTNLSNLRPRPHVKFWTNFTSSQSGAHFLTPKDVATIYDINAAYDAGFTGSGQSIAVVGQSAIQLSDIENFQRASGLPTKDPKLVLVPNSGTSTVFSGDEAESDLDLEYSGGIAKDADIYFVYVGNNSNYSVWDSIIYAVDNRIAPVISTSYGICETALSSSDYATMNGTLAQAAAQGQTIIAAAGDSGSTDCYGETGLTTAQQEALAVDFPASSQYVTAIGGTEFPSADVSASNTVYWASASSSDVISSALSYIPEAAWNDDSSTAGLLSGGGGISKLTGRPSWQGGVAGIPSGSYRLVPDVSLTASPENAGFLFCSSDSAATGITGSCSNVFRDINSTYLTVGGGTSFDSPVFAGMMAIINQRLNSNGQGVANSILYGLAADSTTYASAFHDITSGNNKCTAGSSYCSAAGESEYPASSGYDEVTGLGSIDFYNLLQAWPMSASSPVASQTTLSAASTTPVVGSNDVVTMTVTSGSSSSSATPTGTLTVAVDGTVEISSLALSNGSATYNFSATTTGSHTITATYSGDSIYSSSSGALTLTVASGGGSFSLAATNLTISAGSSGSSTITITPKDGYTGTIAWKVSASPSLSSFCYSLPNTTVPGTSAVTATMTVYTSASACSTVSAAGAIDTKFTDRASVDSPYRPSSRNAAETTLAIAGILFLGLFGYRPRDMRSLLAIFFFAVIGLTLAGCGGSKTSSESQSSSNAQKGTYTLTIVGTDISVSSITASTTMTLIID